MHGGSIGPHTMLGMLQSMQGLRSVMPSYSGMPTMSQLLFIWNAEFQWKSDSLVHQYIHQCICSSGATIHIYITARGTEVHLKALMRTWLVSIKAEPTACIRISRASHQHSDKTDTSSASIQLTMASALQILTISLVFLSLAAFASARPEFGGSPLSDTTTARLQAMIRAILEVRTLTNSYFS